MGARWGASHASKWAAGAGSGKRPPSCDPGSPEGFARAGGGGFGGGGISTNGGGGVGGGPEAGRAGAAAAAGPPGGFTTAHQKLVADCLRKGQAPPSYSTQAGQGVGLGWGGVCGGQGSQAAPAGLPGACWGMAVGELWWQAPHLTGRGLAGALNGLLPSPLVPGAPSRSLPIPHATTPLAHPSVACPCRQRHARA